MPVACFLARGRVLYRPPRKAHICRINKCGLFRSKCSASAEREVCFASEAYYVREVCLRHDGRRNTSHRARHDASQRQRRRGGTSLYAFGSSPAGTCPRPTGSNGLPARGAPGGLRSRSRGTSVTDAAYPLRVRALRVLSECLHAARRVVVPYECGTHLRRRARTRRGYAASVTLVPRERLRRPPGAPRVGTTKSAQISSPVLPAASRTAGTCPRPTKGFMAMTMRATDPPF